MRQPEVIALAPGSASQAARAAGERPSLAERRRPAVGGDPRVGDAEAIEDRQSLAMLAGGHVDAVAHALEPLDDRPKDKRMGSCCAIDPNLQPRRLLCFASGGGAVVNSSVIALTTRLISAVASSALRTIQRRCGAGSDLQSAASFNVYAAVTAESCG